jgi:hypothetical protein
MTLPASQVPLQSPSSDDSVTSAQISQAELDSAIAVSLKKKEIFSAHSQPI